MALFVKCLHCKHKDLDLIPSTNEKDSGPYLNPLSTECLADGLHCFLRWWPFWMGVITFPGWRSCGWGKIHCPLGSHGCLAIWCFVPWGLTNPAGTVLSGISQSLSLTERDLPTGILFKSKPTTHRLCFQPPFFSTACTQSHDLLAHITQGPGTGQLGMDPNPRSTDCIHTS